MGTVLTDFEAYPKHRLENKGAQIQQILDVSEETFGMLYTKANENSFPSLLKTVGGAEHLQKGNSANGSKVFFNDQLEADTQNGLVNITMGDTSVVPVAIGNFATLDSLEELFDEITDIETLEPKPAPVIKYSADFTTINAFSDEAGTIAITEPIDFLIETAYSDSSTSIPFTQTSLSVPAMNASMVGQQRCTAITPGDNTTTKDSDAVYLYQVSLGVPEILNASVNEERYTFVLAKPDNPGTIANLLPADTTIDTSIEFTSCEINYSTGAISSATNITELSVDRQAIGLNSGACLLAWVKGVTGNSDIYIFPASIRQVTNFSYLSAPTCAYDASTQQLSIITNPGVAGVCTIACKLPGADNFGRENDIAFDSAHQVNFTLSGVPVGATFKIKLAVDPVKVTFSNGLELDIKFYNDYSMEFITEAETIE